MNRHPAVAPLLSDYGLLDKHPGDRLSVVTTQTTGMQHIIDPSTHPQSHQDSREHPSIDKNRQRFMKLARGYTHHEVDRVQMCEKNQAVATQAGDIDAAQTWGLLASLLHDAKKHRVATTHQPQGHSTYVPVDSNGQPTTPGSIAEKMKAREPQSATRPRPKSPQLITGEKVEPAVNDGSNSKRKRSGGSAMLFGAPGTHNPKRRDSSPSLLSALRPHTRSPSSSPATRALKLPNTSLSMSYTPASLAARVSFNRRMSRSSGGNSKSNSPGPTPEEKGKAWGGNFAAVAQGALEDSSSDEDEDEASPSDGVVNQSDASIESSWTQEKRAVANMGAGIQHPTLHSSSSSSHSSPAIGGRNSLPPTHLVSNMNALLSKSSSKLSSPQVYSQLLDIQDVNEDDGDESDGIEEDGASRSSDSLHRRCSHSGSSSEGKSEFRGVDVPSERFSPPSPTLAKYMAKSTDSSRTATISKAGLRVMTRQGSDGSATIVNSGIVELGIPGSFGSSIMTPTIGRMSVLGAWPKRDEGISGFTDIQNSTVDNRIGSMTIRTSPAGKSLPLRDMFSSVAGTNGQVTTTPTPTTAVSTQSGLRSALSNDSSRFVKGQYGTLMSSIPALGSAGYDQEGFLFHVENDASDESKWGEEHKELVDELEREERKAMFEVVKDSLEAYAEEGNVQMCASLAMAAHEELDISPERLERFSLAYLGR